MTEGPTKSRALRAVTRCSSVDEFIAGYSRFAEVGTLFVVTRSPRPVGPPRPFIVELSDGSTALRGIAEVVESHSSPTGPDGQCGMKLRLVHLDPASKEIHSRLLSERGKRPPRVVAPAATPTTALPGVAATQRKPEFAGPSGTNPGEPPAAKPDTPPSSVGRATVLSMSVPPPSASGSAGGIQVPSTIPSTISSKVEPPRAPPSGSIPPVAKLPRASTPRPESLAPPQKEERMPGSPYILPANPLSELPPEALDYFVECTLYEHTDSTSIENFAEGVPPDQAAQALPYATTPSFPPRPTGEASTSNENISAGYAAITPSRRPLYIGIGVAASVVLLLGVALALNGGSKKTAAAPTQSVAVAAPAAPPPAAPPSTTEPAPTEIAAAPSQAPSTIPAAMAAETDAAPEPEAAPAVEPSARMRSAVSRHSETASGGCRASITASTTLVQVRWNGQVLGTAPVSNVEIPCGPGELALTHPRYLREVKQVTARAGTPLSLNVVMRRPPASLTFRSMPPGATFSVDGRKVGANGTATVMAYTYVTVSADLAGHRPWKQKVYVRSKKQRVSAKLERSAAKPATTKAAGKK